MSERNEKRFSDYSLNNASRHTEKDVEDYETTRLDEYWGGVDESGKSLEESYNESMARREFEKNAAIEERVMENAQTRFMYMMAQHVAELKSKNGDKEVIKDKEDKLQERIEAYLGNVQNAYNLAIQQADMERDTPKGQEIRINKQIEAEEELEMRNEEIEFIINATSESENATAKKDAQDSVDENPEKQAEKNKLEELRKLSVDELKMLAEKAGDAFADDAYRSATDTQRDAYLKDLSDIELLRLAHLAENAEQRKAYAAEEKATTDKNKAEQEVAFYNHVVRKALEAYKGASDEDLREILQAAWNMTDEEFDNDKSLSVWGKQKKGKIDLKAQRKVSNREAVDRMFLAIENGYEVDGLTVDDIKYTRLPAEEKDASEDKKSATESGVDLSLLPEEERAQYKKDAIARFRALTDRQLMDLLRRRRGPGFDAAFNDESEYSVEEKLREIRKFSDEDAAQLIIEDANREDKGSDSLTNVDAYNEYYNALTEDQKKDVFKVVYPRFGRKLGRKTWDRQWKIANEKGAKPEQIADLMKRAGEKKYPMDIDLPEAENEDEITDGSNVIPLFGDRITKIKQEYGSNKLRYNAYLGAAAVAITGVIAGGLALWRYGDSSVLSASVLKPSPSGSHDPGISASLVSANISPTGSADPDAFKVFTAPTGSADPQAFKKL